MTLNFNRILKPDLPKIAADNLRELLLVGFINEPLNINALWVRFIQYMLQVCASFF